MQAIDKLPLIPAVFEFVGILFSGVRTSPHCTIYHFFLSCSCVLLAARGEYCIALSFPRAGTMRFLYFSNQSPCVCDSGLCIVICSSSLTGQCIGYFYSTVEKFSIFIWSAILFVHLYVKMFGDVLAQEFDTAGAVLLLMALCHWNRIQYWESSPCREELLKVIDDVKSKITGQWGATFSFFLFGAVGEQEWRRLVRNK